jgi:hypothetical protein
MQPTDEAVVNTHSELANIGRNSSQDVRDSFLVFLAFEEAIDA